MCNDYTLTKLANLRVRDLLTEAHSLASSRTVRRAARRRDKWLHAAGGPGGFEQCASSAGAAQ